MKEELTHLIKSALEDCFNAGALRRDDVPPIEVEYPRETAHGDYATNIAMLLAKSQRRKPRDIAEEIVGHISDKSYMLEKTEIAGPGFINFFINSAFWASRLKNIDAQGESYGTSTMGAGKKIQVEFVSANPTGPLHIGHARGAVVGDVLANILDATGHDVTREYYINDAGKQMTILGESVYYRYREMLGDTDPFPDNCYRGDYIRDIAQAIAEKRGDELRSAAKEETVPLLTKIAAGTILDDIKNDLADFGVSFDSFFSEKSLYEHEGVEALLAELEEKNHIYRDGKTLWFRTTDFGDEKDRVVVRENGEPTYFAADIAYHKNKYDRGFTTVIDIWGADHHGYLPRMYAGIQALGKDKNALEIILVQLVNLLRDGVPVAMSTRAGEFVTLREVMDEVGRDAARYHFLMRRSQSHLDFDLELAKRQSNDNPVYYVQYVHARIMSIIRNAAEQGFHVPRYDDVDVGRLLQPEEIDIIKMIDKYPDVIEGCALSFEPHRITFYLNDLASLFHSYYNKHRVISDNRELTSARIFLIASVGTVVRNALCILGVSAPDRM